MGFFGGKKILRGIIEPPRAVMPAPLASLIGGHLIAMSYLHANNFVGFDPDTVTVEFAFSKFPKEEFEKSYGRLVGLSEDDSLFSAARRYLAENAYQKSEEAPMQWQYDKKHEKEEIKKMEMLHLFEIEAIRTLKKSTLKVYADRPKFAQRVVEVLRVPLQIKAAGYNVRIGTYEELKKLRTEDATTGVATPHRITVHLPLTEEEAILTFSSLAEEHTKECTKCQSHYQKTKSYLDPTCNNRPKISFFGFPSERRKEVARKMMGKK